MREDQHALPGGTEFNCAADQIASLSIVSNSTLRNVACGFYH